jgi:DNA-binding transcriptional LysR family regulator
MAFTAPRTEVILWQDDSAVLDWLKTFLTIYRAGSVTAAAGALHLSQPTVSQHLKGLEAHVGNPLFDRLPRGVTPTAAGHELAAALGSHLDVAEIALESARRQPGARSAGTARLGGPAELLSAAVMAALIPALDEGLRLRVELGLAADLIAALRRRELDVVVATARVRAAGVVYEPLYDEELVLVADPRWASRIGSQAVRRRGAAALAEIPIVAYARHLPLLQRYWRHVFGERLAASPRLVAPDLRLLRRAVIAGAGATVLPAYLAAEPVAGGELLALAHPADPPTNTIYLATHRDALDDPRVTLVCELLRRAAPSW